MLVHAQTTVGSALAYERGVDAGQALLADAIRLGVAIGADEQVCRAAVNVAWSALDEQRLDRAEADCATALALADAREQRAFRLYALATRARLHVARGRWDAAVADADEVLAQTEGPAVARIPALTCLAIVEGRRGQARAESLLAEAAGLARVTGELQRLRPVACALAELAWLRGDTEAIDEVTGAPYALALEVGHAWDVGELASWRWRAGLMHDAPACAEPHRLLITGEALAAAECWRSIGDRYQVALCLGESDDPDALVEALCDRRGARRRGPRAAAAPAPTGARHERPARAAAVHPRQPCRAHEPAARDPRARRYGRDERRDRPPALPHPEDRRTPRGRGAWRSSSVTSRAAAVAQAHALGLVEGRGP